VKYADHGSFSSWVPQAQDVPPFAFHVSSTQNPSSDLLFKEPFHWLKVYQEKQAHGESILSLRDQTEQVDLPPGHYLDSGLDQQCVTQKL
jgi:hypothetical protein